jgi:hypothetical protein
MKGASPYCGAVEKEREIDTGWEGKISESAVAGGSRLKSGSAREEHLRGRPGNNHRRRLHLSPDTKDADAIGVLVLVTQALGDARAHTTRRGSETSIRDREAESSRQKRRTDEGMSHRFLRVFLFPRPPARPSFLPSFLPSFPAHPTLISLPLRSIIAHYYSEIRAFNALLGSSRSAIGPSSFLTKERDLSLKCPVILFFLSTAVKTYFRFYLSPESIYVSGASFTFFSPSFFIFLHLYYKHRRCFTKYYRQFNILISYYLPIIFCLGLFSLPSPTPPHPSFRQFEVLETAASPHG